VAYLREKKGNYQAVFYDPSRKPTKKWKTLRTKDKENARQKIADLERKYALGLFDPWQDDIPREGLTVREAVDRFLSKRCKEKGLRETTISKYKYTLKAFADSVPTQLHVRHVDGGLIRDYIDRDELRETSRDTYYRQLKTFFRWCDDRNIIQANPTDDVDRPGAPDLSAEFLNPSQLSHLVETIREDAEANASHVGEGEVLWIIDVIKFAVYTGLRRGELCDLRWGAIDLESGFLTVQKTEDFNTKTGNEDRIPIISPAAKILRRRQSKRTGGNASERVFKGVKGDPLNADYLTERFRYYRRLADLPEGVSFHNLRHTCASLLVMEGTPLHTVKEMLRHSRIEVTQNYSHLAPEKFKNQIEEGMGEVALSLDE